MTVINIAFVVHYVYEKIMYDTIVRCLYTQCLIEWNSRHRQMNVRIIGDHLNKMYQCLLPVHIMHSIQV